MLTFESPQLDLDLKAPEAFGNVAKMLDREELQLMASYVEELVGIDDRSMAEWAGKAEGYLNKADAESNTEQARNYEQQGSGESGEQARTALMMSAAIQFTARITSSVLSEPDLAKASETGAEPLAGWVSSQLRTTDPDWVNDFDPLILHMSLTGLAWRKRWFDEHDEIFRSSWLPSVGKGKVIINANAKSIERAPRLTHEIQKYPYEIERSIDLGHWIDYEPQFDDIDPQALQDFYEVDMWLDLDGDGQEEPWTLTLSLDDIPTVVKITPRWSKKNVTDTKELLLFRPVRRYYAYRMLPDPKGKFFPNGFGWLLNSIENTADNLLGSIEDTAKSAGQDGGVSSTGGVGLPDKIELKRNRITAINTDGKPITQVLTMFPPIQVSPGSVQVLDKVLTLADRLAGTLNLLENAPASMTATLAKGIMDTGSQVQGAVHRRVIGEMTEEFRAFVRLADDMDKLPDGIVSGPVQVSADPNMATEMHRSIIASIYREMLSIPMVFSPKEVGKRYVDTLRLPMPEKLIQMMGPPQPDPQAQAELAVKADANAIKMISAKSKALVDIANAILALSQAGVSEKNAQLIALEIQKLNVAIAELGQDGATLPNGSAGAGSAPGAGGNPQPPTPAAGANAGGIFGGQPGGPDNTGAGGGGGQLMPPAWAASGSLH